MGTRQSESMALVKRAELAGWEVKPAVDGSKGWRIFVPGDRAYHVHMTYSDVNSIKAITRTLEKAGLKQAEADMARTTLTETRTRTTLARQAAEQKAKEMENNAAITKASGPYLVEAEECDPGWLLTPHPAPWMKWMYVTPEVAQTILDEHNADNRPLNDRQRTHYRNIILSQQWHLTHQGLAFDTRGLVQDGQHRLAALVEAGEEVEDLKVPFAVFVGMPLSNFKAIDEGLLRSAAHLFAKGAEKNGSTLAQCVRLVNAYKDQNPRKVMRIRSTNEIIVDTFESDAEEFRICSARGMANYKRIKSSPGAIAAALFLLRRTSGPDNKFVEAFFEGLTTGRKAGTRMALDDDDPRNVLRETLDSVRTKKGAKRITGIDAMGMIILAWNNCITNNRPRLMRFTDETPIPRVIACKDTGPNASATPAVFAGEIDFDEDE